MSKTISTSANQNLQIPDGVKPGDVLLMRDDGPNWIERVSKFEGALPHVAEEIAQRFVVNPQQFYSHAALISAVGENPEDLMIIEAAGRAYSDSKEAGVAERRFIDSKLFGANQNSPEISWLRPTFPDPIREADQTITERKELRALALGELENALGNAFLPKRHFASFAWRWIIRQMRRDGGFSLTNLANAIELYSEFEDGERYPTMEECFDLSALHDADEPRAASILERIESSYLTPKRKMHAVLTEDEARERIVSYARAQIGEPYFTEPFFPSKWSTKIWYCSLLVFKAFSRSVEGMNLEMYAFNLGALYIVFPDDLYRSGKLKEYFRWWQGVGMDVGKKS